MNAFIDSLSADSPIPPILVTSPNIALAEDFARGIAEEMGCSFDEAGRSDDEYLCPCLQLNPGHFDAESEYFDVTTALERCQVLLVKRFDELTPEDQRQVLQMGHREPILTPGAEEPRIVTEGTLIAVASNPDSLPEDVRARFALVVSPVIRGSGEPLPPIYQKNDTDDWEDEMNRLLMDAFDFTPKSGKKQEVYGLSRYDGEEYQPIADAVTRARVLAAAAHQRSENAEPILLCGGDPEELLTFAEAIAEEMGVRFNDSRTESVSACDYMLLNEDDVAVIAQKNQLPLRASNVNVLVVECFDRLPEPFQRQLLEAGNLSAPTEDLLPITLAAICESADSLPNDIRREFALRLTLTPSVDNPIARGLLRQAKELDLHLDVDAACLLASCGDEKSARRLLRRARDLSQLRETDRVTLPLAEQTLELFAENDADTADTGDKSEK